MPQTNAGAQVAAGYERSMGRYSRLVATEFLRWLAPAPGQRWLDLGCGTGALTQAVLRDAPPALVVALDPVESYVAHTKRENRRPAARCPRRSGQEIPLADATVDWVVSGLALNFMPNPAGALKEMARVTAPGGTVALYVWDYAEGMQLLRYFWDAAVALDPAAVALDEGARFPAVCHPDALHTLLTQAGLAHVEVATVSATLCFARFDDYWAPFLSGTPFPAFAYVASLSPERKPALREAVRERLPLQGDGSFELTLRAWAARGGRSDSSS
jgi:SAM-dependent methyltransferase